MQVGCPWYHLTSSRKAALIHKSSMKIPKAFNQHEKVGKIIKYLDRNALTKQSDQSCFNHLWQTSPKKLGAAWVEVSPRAMTTRFQDPLLVLRLTGHSWSLKTTDFWMYIYAYIIDISSSQTQLNQPFSSTSFQFLFYYIFFFYSIRAKL